MSPRDEVVTIDGVVVGEPDEPAVYTAVELIAGDDRSFFVHREAFAVRTADGRPIAVELAKHPRVAPRREVAGPWREVAAHLVRPTGELHPDGFVTLRGTWIARGEPVTVIGYAKEHAFVPATGGPREAPARALARVRGIAIGVGDDAAAAARRAFAERAGERAAQAQGRDRARWLGWIASGSLVAAVGAAIASFTVDAGTLGLANSLVVLAILFGWCTVPTAAFPGGAVAKDDDDTPGVITALVVILLVPLIAILTPFAGPAKRDAAAAGGWVCVGLVPIAKVWRAVLAKPRATPGAQTYLPVNRVARWTVVIGLVVTWIVALVLAVPHLEGDGPMP